MVVAEAAPAYGGQRMARDLARAGLQTTAIPDSAIFAMMARVNKARGSVRSACACGGRTPRPVRRLQPVVQGLHKWTLNPFHMMGGCPWDACLRATLIG